MAGITKPQIRALRTLASQRFGPCTCQRGDCDYHDWLARTFGGITSTKDLTLAQAARAIDALSDRPVQKRRTPVAAPWAGRYKVPGAKGAITQAQADLLSKLEMDLGWAPDPVRLWRFIERQLGKKCSVPMLTKRDATKVITGLKRLVVHYANNTPASR